MEKLNLCYLRSLKDLSTLPFMPRLEHLALRCLHGFSPPDFRNFPNVTDLDISQADSESLEGLRHLPKLRGINLWGAKLEKLEWAPLLELPELLNLNGMTKVFKAAARKELERLRPNLGIDGDFKVAPEDPPYRPISEIFEEARKRFKELTYTEGKGWS